MFVIRVLKGLFATGLVVTPIVIFRKKPFKEWIMIFLLTAFVTAITDKAIVGKGYLKYPTRLFSRHFRISVLFDFILCPLLSVVFNQISYQNKWSIALKKMLYITVPHTILEIFFERKTNFIKFSNRWTWLHSFFSINIKFIIIRVVVRGLEKIMKIS
ncbi:CBO0543 family protein [Salipaludibacillus sp. HK11]|uniref:CBO0543 family protein n=1 Tax=Salipaludibacillus sp. HK11 TaxID=3394320 RepID=UPI0039FBA697